MKLIGYIALGIILVVLTRYISDRFFPRVETVTKTDTTFVTKYDTIKIKQIVYKSLPARIESVFVNNQTVASAKLDTVLGAERDTVKIVYIFPPVNSFDLYLGLAPRPIQYQEKFITTTNDIHHYPTLWDKLEWGAIGGGVIFIVDRVASGIR